MSAKIIDFISHLQQKNDLENIIKQGWDSDNFYFQKNKALNIYLVDKNREKFYFFNCDFDELNSITEAEQKHSRHFLHG